MVRGSLKFVSGLVVVSFFVVACGGGGGGSGGVGGDETLQGGDTTSSDRSALALEHPASNLSSEEDALHTAGDAAFGDQFVTPPAVFNAGLGPLFNNNACEACHTKNGRGQPVFSSGFQGGSQALVRMSVPGGVPEAPGGAGAVEGFGTQLQDNATFGVEPEGTAQITFSAVSGQYGDGTAYSLRAPNVKVTPRGGRRLPSNVQLSLRVPLPVFGLGLLEAIPEADILALADSDDANGDGISGRPNRVWDEAAQATVLGRFGRKANRPNLRQQAASAYANDMGVTNPIFPAPDGSTEITDEVLSNAEFYVQTIAVPAAAVLNDQARFGKGLFSTFQCASCHTPRMRTGSHPVRALRNQTIFPYTDMLLHDMGPGLADNRPDFEATGTEWRTPPLWGVGVTATILSATANFLHDGRARTLEEAILWHGGEAENAKESFRNATAEQRAALVAFLRAL